MLNKVTGEKSALNIVLMTAEHKDGFVVAAGTHAPSGLEKYFTCAGKTADEATMAAFKTVMEIGVTGYDLEISFTTDNDYLNEMLNGEMKAKVIQLKAGLIKKEDIEFYSEWDAVLAAMKYHRVHLHLTDADPMQTVRVLVTAQTAADMAIATDNTDAETKAA